MRCRWKCYMGLGNINSNLFYVWSVSLLRPQFLVLRPPPIGLDSNCELHWLKPFSRPSLFPTCLPQGDDAPLLLLALHDGKRIPDATWEQGATKTHQGSQLVFSAWLHLPSEPQRDWSPALNSSKLAGTATGPIAGLAQGCLTSSQTYLSAWQSQAPEHPELVLPALTLQIRSPLATDTCMKQTEHGSILPLHLQDITKKAGMPFQWAKCQTHVHTSQYTPGQ